MVITIEYNVQLLIHLAENLLWDSQQRLAQSHCAVALIFQHCSPGEHQATVVKNHFFYRLNAVTQYKKVHCALVRGSDHLFFNMNCSFSVDATWIVYIYELNLKFNSHDLHEKMTELFINF